jgi:aryl-phospho-beta-D-glucosidase BglC (GH1 family)
MNLVSVTRSVLLGLLLSGLVLGQTACEAAKQPPQKPAVRIQTQPKVVLPAVTQARLAYLRDGINVGHWFALHQTLLGWEYTPERLDQHLQSYLAMSDFKRMKAMGFTHVRFPIDPVIFDSPRRWQMFDKALHQMLSSGLAVVVDVHPWDDYKQDLFDTELSGTWQEKNQQAAFWSTLAGHLQALIAEKGYSQDRIFLELVNEPAFTSLHGGGWNEQTAKAWNNIQQRLHNAVRAKAPKMTVIASGFDYDSIPSLIEPGMLRFLTWKGQRDPNVVYTAHFYDPHPMTHQGAGWSVSDEQREQAKREGKLTVETVVFPYPLNDKAKLSRIFTGLTSNPWEAQANIERYANGVNANALSQELGRLATWAKANRVPVYIGEYGFMSRKPELGYEAWIRDVRRLCAQYGFGSAFWNYTEGFGLVEHPGADGTVYPGVLRAVQQTRPSSGPNRRPQ